MGFWSNVGEKVRHALLGDKERKNIMLAKGTTSSSYPTSSGFDLLQAYGYDVLSDYLRLENDLMSRFVDYEEMDDYPELSAALDIYADDSTQVDSSTGRSIWVTSTDDSIQMILNDMLHRTLRIEEEIWEISRSLAKYGNNYEELLVTQDGVRGLNFLPAPTTRRIEGPRGELFGFIQDYRGRFSFSPAEFSQILAARASSMGKGGSPKDVLGNYEKVAALEDWEVVHMRLRSKQRRSIYGFGVMESARWIWKRLVLLEDAAMIYRLQRAPERFAFYVNVGDVPPHEALAFVNKVRQMHKKRKFYDVSTGKLSMKWEPFSQDDDFWLPMRKGEESTRVEVMNSPNWQHMDDVEYFSNKMYAAIKVPKAYLGQEEGVSRAVLSSEDVRFARTVLRNQRELRNGISKICRVHLAAIGIPPDKVSFEVHMTSPSAIFELAQIEARTARADLAGRMQQFVSMYWILSHIFRMTDSEIQEIFLQREEDMKNEARLRAEAESAAVGAVTAAQAAAMSGEVAPQDFYGGEEGGEEEGGQEEDPGAPPEEAPEEEPEGPQETSTGKAGSLVERKMRRVRKGKPKGMGRHRIRRMSKIFRPRGRMTEQELFAGDREAEKRLEGKLDDLLKRDVSLRKRFAEFGDLLHEIRSMGGSRRR